MCRHKNSPLAAAAERGSEGCSGLQKSSLAVLILTQEKGVWARAERAHRWELDSDGWDLRGWTLRWTQWGGDIQEEESHRSFWAESWMFGSVFSEWRNRDWRQTAGWNMSQMSIEQEQRKTGISPEGAVETETKECSTWINHTVQLFRKDILHTMVIFLPCPAFSLFSSLPSFLFFSPFFSLQNFV